MLKCIEKWFVLLEKKGEEVLFQCIAEDLTGKLEQYLIQNWHNETISMAYPAKYGLLKTVMFLSFNESDVNATDKNGKTALMYACQNGDMDMVKFLVENRQDIDGAVNSMYEETALWYACENGSLEIVRYLFEKNLAHFCSNLRYGSIFVGISYRFMFCSGWTPLAKAIDHSFELVKYLVERGADIFALDFEGWSTLMIVASFGTGKMFKYLVEKGADVMVEDKEKWNVLAFVARYGTVQMAQIAVEHGADTSKADLLVLTAQYGSFELLKFFVDIGCDVNCCEIEDSSALTYAAARGEDQMVKYLVENGADWNVGEDICGWYVLLHAVNNCSFEAVNCLIDNGVDVNKVGSNGWTPLLAASRKGSFEIVKYLVENGANVNYRNEKRATILQNAIQSGSLAVVQYLFEQGANTRGDDEISLNYALRYGTTEIVMWLIEEAGVDVNFSCKDSKVSPLMQCIRFHGDLKVIKCLIDRSANVNAVDKK